MQGFIGVKNVANGFDATFLRENSTMPRKKSSTPPMGRPKSISITAEKIEQMGNFLTEAGMRLRDAAKEMRENNVESMTLKAAKVMDEHIPACQRFSVYALAEVGPSAAARFLNRKTSLEQNQERYQRSKRKGT